jgi:hypothetical protein
MTAEEETALKRELLKMDVDLRRKQTFWETPRNLAVLLGAMAAIFAAVFGLLGYKIGSTPPPPPVVIYLTPQGQPTQALPTPPAVPAK